MRDSKQSLVWECGAWLRQVVWASASHCKDVVWEVDLRSNDVERGLYVGMFVVAASAALDASIELGQALSMGFLGQRT